MKHLGDITKIHGDQIEPVDCITFGSPCQGLSMAGKRLGFDDDRSVLFLDAARIIRRRMITCCKDCTSRHQACHDTCEKYKAEKKDFEERKAFVYELNHSQSVYHRDYEDKHRQAV